MGLLYCFYLNTNVKVFVATLPAAGPPRWRDDRPPQSVVTAEDDEVRVACRTDGHPPPAVTWTINGQPIAGQTAQCCYNCPVSKQIRLPVLLFTARHSYASAVCGVVILSVRMSHTRACDKTKQRTQDTCILIYWRDNIAYNVVCVKPT